MAHSNEYPIDDETRGWALLGKLLSHAILTLLRKRGIISDADAEFTVDLVLDQLEILQMKLPDDQSLTVARASLQAILDGIPPSQARIP